MIAIVLFTIILDLYLKYPKAKNDKKIDSERCWNTYYANECHKISIDDGPLLNDICDENKKCMEDKSIGIIQLIVYYIKDIFGIKTFNVLRCYLIILTAFTFYTQNFNIFAYLLALLYDEFKENK